MYLKPSLRFKIILLLVVFSVSTCLCVMYLHIGKTFDRLHNERDLKYTDDVLAAVNMWVWQDIGYTDGWIENEYRDTKGAGTIEEMSKFFTDNKNEILLHLGRGDVADAIIADGPYSEQEKEWVWNYFRDEELIRELMWSQDTHLQRSEFLVTPEGKIFALSFGHARYEYLKGVGSEIRDREIQTCENNGFIWASEINAGVLSKLSKRVRAEELILLTRKNAEQEEEFQRAINSSTLYKSIWGNVLVSIKESGKNKYMYLFLDDIKSQPLFCFRIKISDEILRQEKADTRDKRIFMGLIIIGCIIPMIVMGFLNKDLTNAYLEYRRKKDRK